MVVESLSSIQKEKPNVPWFHIMVAWCTAGGHYSVMVFWDYLRTALMG